MMAGTDSPDTIPSLAASSLEMTPPDKVSRALFPSTELTVDDMMMSRMMMMKQQQQQQQQRRNNNNTVTKQRHAFHDEECSQLDGTRSIVTVDLEAPYAMDRQGIQKSILSQSEHFLHHRFDNSSNNNKKYCL